MFCIHCGTQNTDGNRFCIKCGQPLEQPGPAGEQPDAWQAPPQQDWAEPQTGGQATQQDWAAPAPDQPVQGDWAQPQDVGQATQQEWGEPTPVRQDWAEPQTGGQPTQQDWAEPDSFTGGSAPTGEASWPGSQEPTGERWAPFSDSEPSVQPGASDWAPGTDQGLVGTATQDTIVRNGTWSSSDLVTPPPAPVPNAGGRGRPGLVIALCAATALCAAGALTYLLLRDKLVAAQAPAFSIFIPIALGGAALIFAAAAVLVILSGRQPVQQVVEDAGPYAGDPYQPAPPASAGIPVTLTDTARPGEPFRLLLEGPVVIGRVQEECDLALPYEKSVSRRHCRIYPSQGTVYVEDLGGRNGTYLNGTQVVVPTSLHSGDMIKLGRLVLRVDIGE